MAQGSLIQVRVDDDLKKEADNLFTDLGLDTPTAIRIFLKQSVKQHGLPFNVCQPTPNAETIEALEETQQLKQDINRKTYDSFSELLAEVEADV